MNPVELEQVRMSLLRYLGLNPTPYGLPVRLLRQYLAAEGQRCSEDEILAELLYLGDKALVAETTKLLNPELRSFRITAAGRDFCAQQSGGR